MPHTPGRGHEALRRGRWSIPGADYFLTFCTQDRVHGLTAPAIQNALLDEAARLSADGVWRFRTGVVMPDHVHLLVAMIGSTELSDAVRFFKGRLTPVLRKSNLSWQRAYFDHRVRDGEDLLPVFAYVFLNPHRARLLDRGSRWSGYYCCEEDWAWFGTVTDEAAPVPEWLA